MGDEFYDDARDRLPRRERQRTPGADPQRVRPALGLTRRRPGGPEESPEDTLTELGKSRDDVRRRSGFAYAPFTGIKRAAASSK